MISAVVQSSIRALSNEAQISSRIARTENVRVEFLQCSTPATVQWSVTRPQVSLMWVRDKGSDARITMSGREADSIRPGRAKFWFFPEGVGAEGELTGKGAYDCAGVFIEPSFLPPTVRHALSEPIAGFSHDALGRAFDEMAGELTDPDEVLPLFTDGWAMQALAYVARATRTPQPGRVAPGSGLAPWQLRRAKDMLLAELSENVSLDCVAGACKLSVSHFARAFKASTGVPPHQWLVTARLEKAKGLLTNSPTPLVDVAGICGFADQSHFSRVFARVMGSSPGAWRREHRA
jgi:AraC-like DNA-binding protein